MNSAKPELLALFGKAPAEAVKYFDSKAPIASEGWETVDKQLHEVAFTVAQTAGFDVIKDIQAALIKARDEGLSIKQFQDLLKPILQSKGWWGKAIDPSTGEILKSYPGTSRPVKYGSPQRLQLIYDTNMATSYAAGRRERQVAVKSMFPYWRYVAVMDRRTRPAHAALNGMVFRADSPFWAANYPPNGFRCRCTVQALTEEDIAYGDISVQLLGEAIRKEVIINKAGDRRDVSGWKTSDGREFYPDVGFDKVIGQKGKAQFGGVVGKLIAFLAKIRR